MALNPRQKTAVETIEGPLLVLAGPGTGKTELLSLRVANILKKTDTLPQNILCLTFTDSGASAMRQRLVSLIGEEAYRVSIETFHSFGTSIIERYPEYFYGGAHLHPADTIIQREVLQKLFDKLARDNPLKATHPEQGYVYLSEAHGAIGHLKKAGLSPEEFRLVLSHNEKIFAEINRFIKFALPDRFTKKNIVSFNKTFKAFARKKSPPSPLPHVFSYREVFLASLSKALNESLRAGTRPLSLWKTRWVARSEKGEVVLKDSLSLQRLRALQGIYRKYNEELYGAGYFDFDDMLLQVILALQSEETLRYEIQETYQYLLVDEFQDTNDAQMRLLLLLLNAPVLEGKPNIMVVGDDDQAIFKFQGAETGNFMRFIKSFENPATVTLSENYRSAPVILNLASSIIKRGEERLENLLPSIVKTLTPSARREEGKVSELAFRDSSQEYAYVAREIGHLSKLGLPLKKIAVIARTHASLVALAPFLYARAIPVRYERQQDVLKEPHIRELITISRFLSSVGRKEKEEADNLLPLILSFSFWGIPRKVIWEISLLSRKRSSPWLEVMRESLHSQVRSIAAFLLDLSIRSHSEPLEYILDELVGSHVSLLSESDDEVLRTKKKYFVSPFKEYYFSREKFAHGRAEYLVFLSGLRVFVDALREHKKGKPLSIDDLVEFVDLHEKNGLVLNDTSAFTTGKEAVTLLTAHKAKGLEFDTVFVLHSEQNVWAGRGKGLKIFFPKNLPLAPAADTSTDQIRLFYVAITRAKRRLYLLFHEYSEEGKEILPLEFLSETFRKQKVLESAAILTPLEHLYYPPFVKDEKALLVPLLEEYSMSVTHLNNFLNVVHGGPQFFLEQNLLRFPQGKTLANTYGSAMHRAIETLYRYFRKEEKLPTLSRFLRFFKEALEIERLSPSDFQSELTRGEKALRVFYAARKKTFDRSDLIEVNFKRQNVRFQSVPLSGQIDKMVKVSASEIRVYDFKTGRVYRDFKGKSDYEKLRLREYTRQLAFYKILVEGSRDFKEYTVKEGVLEFLEPSRGNIISLSLSLSEELVSRTEALMKGVYKKIQALSFPNVSKYEKNIAGVIRFEDDIIKGA